MDSAYLSRLDMDVLDTRSETYICTAWTRYTVRNVQGSEADIPDDQFKTCTGLCQKYGRYRLPPYLFDGHLQWLLDLSDLAARLRRKPCSAILGTVEVQGKGYLCYDSDARLCYGQHVWERVRSA